jgi:hypothetical protein
MSHEDLKVFKKNKISLKSMCLNGTSEYISFPNPSSLCVGLPELNPMQKRFVEFLETNMLTSVTYRFREYGNCFFEVEKNEYTMEVSKRGAGKTTALMYFIKKKIAEGASLSDFLCVTPHPSHMRNELREIQLKDITIVDFGLIRGAHFNKICGHKFKWAIFDDVKWSEARDLDHVKADKKIYSF